MIARTPAKRLASTEDVVHAVFFLLDNKAVNGIDLEIDGGIQLVWAQSATTGVAPLRWTGGLRFSYDPIPPLAGSLKRDLRRLDLRSIGR
jgi:hypothetical protein